MKRTIWDPENGSFNTNPLPANIVTAGALENTIIPAALVVGANCVTLLNTGTTPANLQMPLAADIIAALVSRVPTQELVGFTYELDIRNNSASANTATITTNTGVTLVGTMTIAQNATRRFLVQVLTASTISVTSVGLETGA